ncbi:MAG: M24 family metallopeptidase, partial [Actinomycetes bacterium]
MSSTIATTSDYLERIAKVRAAMTAQNVDAALLSVGHDLPYLSGYVAMPLERLTMLVVPRSGQVNMVVPRLEVPRVVAQPEVFSIVPWNETDNPIAIVATLLGDAKRIAVGDQMWARFLVELLPHVPGATFTRAVDVVGALRMSKDASEIAALRAAGAAADRVAAQLHAGRIPLIGRTEAAVSADISSRLIAEGHDVVNFAIVAAGENAASPHHHAGSRVIQPNEIVLCDFGGTMNGYCSDITRCVFTGQIASDVADAYAVLFESQAAGVAAGIVGNACEEVDRASRAVI